MISELNVIQTNIVGGGTGINVTQINIAGEAFKTIINNAWTKSKEFLQNQNVDMVEIGAIGLGIWVCPSFECLARYKFWQNIVKFVTMTGTIYTAHWALNTVLENEQAKTAA